MSALFDLSGKVALVTGGNGGLGLGFARGIAKQGGAVEIWGRSEEKNAKAKAELEEYGVKVTARQVDVSSEEQVVAGFKALISDHGRLDAVFANSGVPAPTRSLLETTSEQWHSLLDINMHGAFYTLREGARLMVERAENGEPGGSLVFCGSLSMFQGIPGKAQYAAAKAGIGAAIRCMAVEFGRHGIRANSIAPGYIKTEMTGSDAEWSDIDKFFASRTPVPRPGYTSDFEGIAAYLASDASSFHTGDTLVIDGAALITL
ncbi:SDR family oxidoreductase [Spongiibacter nanhainus]|uniref:SDR family oxidoreductase n=1 Tax=Spongiibacter nanhainus TaxID=2794344 RepID=A0A7T4R2W0_9GAMM|nr:SDR family oxidoreductase [Spongiibacter nanhainus]QQD19453.1 SDR family oxidoreductase [Spongiibacter nanhainus]